jgi:hypothetical protein
MKKMGFALGLRRAFTALDVAKWSKNFGFRAGTLRAFTAPLPVLAR